MSTTSPRLIAGEIIAQVIARTLSLKPTTLATRTQILSPSDARFVSLLCFGVLRFYHRLDSIAKQLLKKPLPPGKGERVYALLLSGLYQLDYLNTPAYAALNETVNAAKALKAPWAAGLINACLRHYVRHRATITQQLYNNPVALYSHPQWLIDTIKKAWPAQWEHILKQNNQPPPMCLRLNLSKVTRESYLKQLADNKQAARAGQFCPGSIILNEACPTNQLPPPRQAIYVQDQSPQLATHLLELAPHQRVLDACAAPGGKALHILQTEPHLTELVAVEKQADRLSSLQKALAPYAKQTTIIHGDASQPTTTWNAPLFDRILLDAPCSATGVIRRHPDIKLLRQKSDIKKHTNEQWALLKALWPLLKPGGYLLYCTCSMIPDENDLLIARFMASTKDCQEKPLDVRWGVPRTVGRQILPSDELDGFYYARLVKGEG